MGCILGCFVEKSIFLHICEANIIIFSLQQFVFCVYCSYNCLILKVMYIFL